MRNTELNKIHRLLLGTALTASLAFTLPNISMAQQAADDVELEEVIVTGSRIKRSNLTTPTPVTSIDALDIQLSGRTNIIDVIKEMPALLNSTDMAGSVTQAPAGSVSGSGGGLSTGLALADLRGLGTKRTLVLVNGRRHVGARAGDTAVDIGTIPNALVESVQVLTGGASAIYGADAVSGVVNFIMKKDFQGLIADANYSTNTRGDGQNFNLSIAGGANFDDDRGNATFSLSYDDAEGLTCGQRDFCRGNNIENDLSNTGSGAPRIFGSQPTFSISSKHGRIGFSPDGFGALTSGADADAVGFFLDTDGDGINDVGTTDAPSRFGFGDWVFVDGQLRLFESGTPAGCCNQFGGDGIEDRFDSDSLSPKSEKVTGTAAFRYKVLENVTFFAESKFVQTSASSHSAINTFNDLLTVKLANPFIPQILRDAMEAAVLSNPDDNPDPTLFITRDNIDIGPAGNLSERNTFRIVTGFEGELDNGFAWELSYNFGRTDETRTNFNQRIDDRFFAAIDVVVDPSTGEAVCRSTLDPSAPPPPTADFPFVEPGFRTFKPGDGQCQPINLFGVGAPSQAAIDFIMTDTTDRGVITQEVIAGVISGDSSSYFELPAGSIGFAFGGEYRKEASRWEPNEFDKSGLVFSGESVRGVEGDYDVIEGFGEMTVPLIRDMKFIQDLSVDGAIRFSDYSTIGSTTSWKVGGNYTVTDDIRFRGTYSVAVRAPNIGELFQAPTATFFRPEDPCDATLVNSAPNPSVRKANCAAAGLAADFIDPLTGRFPGLIGGNELLQEEKATTYTFGAVLTPEFLPGFSATVDYWNIRIDDAIQTVGSQDIVNNCFDDPDGIDNQFCELFTRNTNPDSPSFQGLNFLQQGFVNIGGRRTAGIDFDVRYGMEMDDMGGLVLSVQGTWLQSLYDKPNQLNDKINRNLLEFRRPEWVVNTNLRYTLDNLTVNYRLRYQSGQLKRGASADEVFNFEDDADFTPLFENPFTGSAWIHNISASYMVDEMFTVTAGVNNLLDRDPFLSSTGFPTGPQGRSFFLSGRATF